MKCYGIFFIAYQERFKSSASETSLILTVQNITMSFTGKLEIILLLLLLLLLLLFYHMYAASR